MAELRTRAFASVATVVSHRAAAQDYYRLTTGAPAPRHQRADGEQVRLKIVVEPSSAVPLAIILKNCATFAGKRVGVIITGGDVDLEKRPWQA